MASDATSPRAWFWPLMERWQLDDETALRLIGHWVGGQPGGKRPRFRLNTSQQRLVGYLREIGAALDASGLDPAWLRRAQRGAPFHGSTPLHHMSEGGEAAMAATLLALTKRVLKASLAAGKGTG